MEKDIKIVMEERETWTSKTTINELLNKALNQEKISTKEFIALTSIIHKIYEYEKRKNPDNQVGNRRGAI